LTVVLTDGPGGSSSNPDVRVISPLDLGVEERELHRRALLYDPQGLISSLRPLAISHLLDEGASSVLLLDADMLALGPLDDLWELAAEDGVLLSPHTLSVREDEVGIRSDERYLLSGTFNGGLLGVGEHGRAFLHWMAARVARDCVRDLSRGLLYSQTWLNLVPALFDHQVLRDPGVNVTAHRLAGRDLEGTLAAPRLDGAPVRLFHFTGFDPASPQTLCPYLEAPYGSLENRPLLSALCRRYAEALADYGWPSPVGYGWARLACGLPVDEVMRNLYRSALLASEQGNGKEPPDPFDRDDPGRFLRWLREPSGELSHYLLALRAMREDLRARFPNVPGADTPAYVNWAKAKAEPEPGAEPEFPPVLASAASRRRTGLRRLLAGSR
jgi:hypothetical protein